MTSSERINWMSHAGHEVLKVDYSRLDEAGMLELLDKVWSYYEGKPPNSVVCLIDLTDTKPTGAFVEGCKKLIKKTKSIERRAAVLGIGGLKAVLLNSVNILMGYHAKAFTDKEAALEWLVS